MGNDTESRPTIAVLTGGGDVPGLNPCIKTIVSRADSEGINVLGIRRGWPASLNTTWMIRKLALSVSSP